MRRRTRNEKQAGSGVAGEARDKVLALLPGILLAAVVLAVFGFLTSRGASSHYVTPDEADSVIRGRAISGDPLSFFSADTNRGLERGVVLLAAIAAFLTDSAQRQIELVHAMVALAQALVAVPVFFACRELGLSRWQALAPAILSSTGAFAVYGTFILNSSIGVLAIALLVWATIHAVRRPGITSDALVVVAAGFLALARLGWAPLAAATLPALVGGAWFSFTSGAGGAMPMRERLMRFPAAFFRSHRLFTAAVAAAAVLLLVVGPSSLVGGYGAQIIEQKIEASKLLANGEYLVVHIAIGAALIPLMLAIPVMLRNLVRPPAPAPGAYAWLALGMIGIFSFVYYQSTNEDRYLAVLFPVVAIGAGLAVFQRPAPRVWAVLATAVVVAVAVRANYFRPATGPFDFFISPTSMFMSNAIVQRATAYVSLSTAQVATLLLAGSAATAAVVAYLRSDRWRASLFSRVFCGGVLVAVLIWQLLAMDYPSRKFVEALGMPGASDAAIGFIDRSGNGGTTRPLAPNGMAQEELRVQLPLLGTFNSSLAGQWTVGFKGRGLEATVDPGSGSVRAGPGLPDKVLFRSGFVPIGLAGTEQPVPQEFSYARLMELEKPVRARWVLLGFGEAGYLTSPAGGRIRFFPRANKGLCASWILITDPRVAIPLGFRIASGGRPRTGVLQPGQPVSFERKLVSGAPVTYRLTSELGRLPDGSRSGAGVFDVAVRPCGPAS